MEFSIRGIGIIKEADIKMDGLTVIAGSNNSGKTTVGRALYAVTSAVEDLAEKQQTDQAMAVFYRIRKIVEPFDGWLSRSRYLSREEVASEDLISEVIGINHIFSPEKRDYYIDLLFRLCESMEKGSFIELLIDNLRDVVGNSESAIRNDWEDHKEKILKECLSAREFVESFQQQTKKEFAYKMIEETLAVEFSNQVQSYITVDEGGISKLELKNSYKEFYGICISENRILEDKSSFTEGYYDKTYFVDDPYIMEDRMTPSYLRAPYGEEKHVRVRIMSHRDKMRRMMRYSDVDRGISETIYREQEIQNVMKKIDAIVPGKVFKGVYQTATGRKLKVENLATGSKVFSIIKKILTSGDLTDKTLLILDEPESHLHPSWINQLAEVIILLVKECNMTVLLTTHSPNFLLAVDALMRKYEIREKCHFYQTELEENNQIKYVEKTDCLDNIYADFAASFAEMNALRKKYMNLEE